MKTLQLSDARGFGLGRRWIIAAALGLAIAGAIGPAAAQAPPSEPAAERAVPVETPTAPPATTPGELQPAPGLSRGNLPHDLSPWSMFAAADWLVKAVMLSLAFASVVTWTVWLAKSLELMVARRRLSQDLGAVADERSLEAARAALARDRGVLPALLAAAQHELSLSSDVTEKEGIKERVASRLVRLEAAAGRRINRGTGVLATIGSTAPFVGLFGTVWGIMNSFIGISKAQTTNLAVVAPGIAEALLATAIGLVAAIPAVIIYNHFSRQISGYRALVADAGAEVQRLVSRDLDRARKPHLSRAAE
ncbi:MAG: tonB-system energizer ExbB [Hyphomicrobiaceae bacterium]|nr:tonB-system energizer ExbB [Hyphomicrobiaceae bacterium]